ncbi:MAG: type IV secretion system DNA-binding domain-containing protein [Candidatus Daviesbacteria bacterium]|nr:type IV secretion system DNA-binding domain-containing protein [Candidatus Daviesbacteria bacterium]
MDSQQTNELIQKLKTADMSQGETMLLIVIMSLPLPVEWRIAIYQFLAFSHLPSIPIPHLSPLQLFLFYVLSPLWAFLILLFLLIFLNLVFSFIIKPLFLLLFGTLITKFFPKQENVFLEITFPVKTSQSAYSTEQLFTHIHSLASRYQGFMKRLLGFKRTYSLEIASSRDDGIKFYLSAPAKDAEILRGGLLSYLPGIKIKVVEDYLKKKYGGSEYFISLFDLKLSNTYPYPLRSQKILEEHDPISYLTGSMTKLSPGELISFQIITTPVLNSTHRRIINKIKRINQAIRKGKPVSALLNENIFQKISSMPGIGVLMFVGSIFASIMGFVLKFIASIPMAIMESSNKNPTVFMPDELKVNVQEILNPVERQISEQVREKVEQHLFETTMRVLVMAKDNDEVDKRVDGIVSSFSSLASTYQSIIPKSSFLNYLPLPPKLAAIKIQNHFIKFKDRTLSDNGVFNQNPILSASEISDIYHLPYTYTTKTEGLVKDKSKELSLPLSQKKSSTKFDVVLGTNSYGGEILPLGLSEKEKRQHTYIVGKSGMGKTNLIEQMAYQDMLSGKGIAIIDPHGDMIKHLLTIIPKKRIKDVVLVNPDDKDFPVGLNMLAPNTKFKDRDDEIDNITKSVMSVFQKITPKEHWGQRMEHILRNAILTSLEVDPKSISTPYRSFLMIQKLLTDSDYLNEITKNLSDPILKQFWEKEFSMFGDMQMASVISPLTNKLGEFITSKGSRNILLQEKSTINIQKIMDESKILLVNLSKGSLGEERSNFFGTLIISLIQLAVLSREKIPESKRTDFFVYIDEFQNFATEHFTSLFSESRKYKVFFIPAHQNIAQIDDPKLAKVVLSNSGNIIAFKNGPDDEQILLPFLEPEVEKGEIVNLPPHHFYIKVTNADNEDAFSGATELLDVRGSEKTAKEIINHSRKTYATKKSAVENQLVKLFEENKTFTTVRQPKNKRAKLP